MTEEQMVVDAAGGPEDAIPWVRLIKTQALGIDVASFVYHEASGSFILFSVEGQPYQLPADSDELIPFEGKIDASKPYHLRYAPARHSFVFHCGNRLLVRRDQSGTVLLNSAFSTDAPCPPRAARFEFPLQEALEWQKFYAAKGKAYLDLECPPITMIVSLVEKDFAARGDGPKPRSLLIVLPEARTSLNVLAIYAAKMKKDNTSDYPLFPLIHWLIERIRWSIDANRPYHTIPVDAGMPTPTSSRAIETMKNDSNLVDVNTMNSEAARVLTFKKWPHMNFKYALPYRMAETGFFYQPNGSGQQDRVVCFSCSISLVMWDPNDEPLQEHERHHTNHCRFMEECYNDNVPLDVTSAILPAIDLPYTPQTNSRVVSSTFNVSAEFHASCMCEPASNYIQICMVHLDSAPMVAHKLRIPLAADFMKSFPDVINNDYPVMRRKGIKVTAMAVAGKERDHKIDDSDAECELFVGIAVHPLFVGRKTDSDAWVPFVLVYRISRHLERISDDGGDSDRADAPSTSASERRILSSWSSTGDPFLGIGSEDGWNPKFEEAPPDDYWSSDDIIDDYDFSPTSTMPKPGYAGSKKVPSKGRHEDPSPTVELSYDPFVLRHSLLRAVDLSRVGSDDVVPALIESITVSDVDNGLVCAVLKPQTDGPSRIVHFERDFQVTPLSLRTYTVQPSVLKTVILPVDHFVSARVVQMGVPGSFGTNVAIGSTVFLTSNNSLCLFDPVSDSTIVIAKDATNFAIDEKQNVVYTDTQNNLKTAVIAAPLAGIQTSKFDELAISMVASITEPMSNSNVADVAEAFKDHAGKNDVLELLRNLDVTKEITPESLAKLHSLVQSESVLYATHVSKGLTPRTAIAANESFLQHHLGFQMAAPPHWVEVAQNVENQNVPGSSSADPSPSVPAAAAASASARPKDASADKDESRLKPTRLWRLFSNTEAVRRSYVFEMAILPGMPLAHFNFKFGFNSAKHGCPDAQFSIFRSRKHHARQSVPITSDIVRLVPFCENPALLDNQCDRVLDPVQLRNHLDPKGTSSTIQISTTFILEALAKNMESLEESWFTKPVTLYLLIETSPKASLHQQINARTTMLANVVKNRNRGDKSTRSSKNNPSKKKSHYARKAITMKPQSASHYAANFHKLQSTASSLVNRSFAKRKDAFRNKTVPEPPAPSSAHLDLTKLPPGNIDEFSVTLFRATTTEPHSQLQRLLLQKDPTVQTRLVDIALRKAIVGSTIDEIYGSQIRALDLLIWVSTNWRSRCSSANSLSTSTTARIVHDLLKYIIQEYPNFYTAAFARASRSVSQKWSTFFGQIIRILVHQDTQNVEAVLSKVVENFTNSIYTDITKISTSSGLHWFLSTVFATVYSLTHMSREGDQIKAVDALTSRCVEVVQQIGFVFQSKWMDSPHYSLSTKYGYNSLAFELEFFDAPTQLMGYRYLTDNVPIDYDSMSMSCVTRRCPGLPMNTSAPTAIGGSMTASQQMNAHMQALQAFGHSYPKFNNGGYGAHKHTAPAPSTSESSPDGDVTLVSGKLFPIESHDTMPVLEMLNVNLNDDWQTKRANWASTSGSHDEWFDMFEIKGPIDKSRATTVNANSLDVASRYSWKRFPIGSELMSCLLEVEPLGFTVATNSDHTKLFNPDTDAYVPFETIVDYPVNNLAPEVKRFLDVSVPTTSVIFEEDFEVGTNFARDLLYGFLPPADYVLCFERVTAHSKRIVTLDFGGPTILTDFIIPPCEYVSSIIVDGFWSDREERVRLGYSGSIGFKSLIVSGMSPGVIVQKIQLTYVMRRSANIKMRVPIGRFWGTKWLIGAESELAHSTAKPSVFTSMSISAPAKTYPDNLALPPDARSSLTSVLEFYCEDVRSRYTILSGELQAMVNDDSASATQMRDVYRECTVLRYQWNTAYRILERLREAAPGSADNSPVVRGYEALPFRSLNTLPMEQLKTLGEYMTTLLSQLSNVVDLRDATREVTGQTLTQAPAAAVEQLPPALRPDPGSRPRIGRLLSAPLMLNTALELFDRYCSKSIPSLQAMTTAYIFKAGVFTDWWGDFFPLILRKYFDADDYNTMDTDVFPLLSVLCAHSVKHGHLQQVVMEKLFHFVVDISTEILAEAQSKNAEDEIDPPKVSPLLSWTLQLMSTAFDVVSSNKRKTDRWSFLSGTFTHTHANSWAPSSLSTPSSSSQLTSGTVMDSLNKYLGVSNGIAGDYYSALENPSAEWDPKTTEPLQPKLSPNSANNIYEKFRECLGGEEFFTELDKPNFIARRLEILQYRLAYLYALIKAENTPDRPLAMPTKDYRAILAHLKSAGEASGLSKSSCPPSTSSQGTNLSPVMTGSSANSQQPSEELSKSRLMIVPLHNLQSRIRVRQYSARLKISESLCLNVVKALLELILCENSSRIVPLNSQLIALKVISKVCLHGAMVPISLTAALGDHLPKLIFKLIENSYVNDWMRHALLMLLIDLTDGEMRTLGRATSKTEAETTLLDKTLCSIKEKKNGDEDGEDTDDLGVERKRHKPDTDVEASEDNSVSNDVTVDQDMDMEDVTSPETATPSVDPPGVIKSETAVACGVGDIPYAFEPETSEFVTFANFDKPDPDLLDDYILRAALATIVGGLIENPDCFKANYKPEGSPAAAEAERVRIAVCLQYCFRLARMYIDRGDPTTLLWHYFDDAFQCEHAHYKANTSLTGYLNTWESRMMERSRAARLVPIEPGEKAMSADNFILFLDTYMTSERIVASRQKRADLRREVSLDGVELRWQQAVTEAKYFTRVDGIRAIAKFQGMPEELSKLDNHVSRIKYKLLELTAMAVDGTGVKMCSAEIDQLKNADQWIYGDLINSDPKALLDTEFDSLDKCLKIQSKLIFVRAIYPHSKELTKPSKSFNEHTLVEMSSSFNEAGTPSEQAIANGTDPTQPLDTAELKCALDSLTSELHLAARMRIFNTAVHLQFASEIGVAISECLQVQPQDTCAEHFVSASLGYRASLDTRNTEYMRQSLSRNVLYNFVPHCPTPKRSSSDEAQSSSGLGASVHAIVTVVDEYLRGLTAANPTRELNDILLIYLEFVAYVDCAINAYTSNKSFSLDSATFTPPAISTAALAALLNYVVASPEMPEFLWQETLTTVNRSLAPETSQVAEFANAVNLEQMLIRFFSCSCNTYGLASSFGPTSQEQFGILMQRLMSCAPTNVAFFNLFVDLLNKMLVRADGRPAGLGDLSIDSLFIAIQSVAQNVAKLPTGDACDVEKLALLLYRVLLAAREAFPRTDAVLRTGQRYTSSTLNTNQLTYTNLCFSQFANQVQEIAPLNKTGDAESKEVIAIGHVVNLPGLKILSTTKTNVLQDPFATRRSKLIKSAFAVDTMDEYYMDNNLMSNFEGLRPYSGDPVLERCTRDRGEGLFVLLIRFVESCSFLGPVWKLVIERFPEAVSAVIDVLGDCESAVEALTDIPVYMWKPTTLADHLLYTLLAISNKVGDSTPSAKTLIHLLIDGMFSKFPKRQSFVNKSPTACSHPLVYSLLTMCNSPSRQSLFVQLDGHKHVAEFLTKTINLVAQHWPPKMSLFKMGTHQNNLANDINGITPTPFDVRVLPNKTINGLRVYNFAPSCRVVGNPTLGNNTGNLMNVLQDPVPQRRTKYINYAYTFQPTEVWMSFTVTLPVPAMLQEVQIRFHQTNSPSAVQIELSTDAIHWTLFGGQVGSTGLPNVGIDTSLHKAPVGSIRIHLRRPHSQAAQINLHQILIYCTSTATASDAVHDQALEQWLTVFDKLQPRDIPLSQFAPKLSQSMILLYLRLPPEHRIYTLLRSVIGSMDLQQKPSDSNFIQLLVRHIIKSGRLSNGPPPVSTAELLFDFCTPSAEVTPQRALHHMRQLLYGVEQLMEASESDNASSGYDDASFAIFLWAAACVLWQNVVNKSFDEDISSLALQFGQAIGTRLWDSITTDTGNAPRHHQLFRQSQAWLLCSICRCAPLLSVELIKSIDAVAVANPGGNHTGLVYDAIGRVFASREAATGLVASATWNDALDAAKSFAAVAGNVDPSLILPEQLERLLPIVNMLASLSEIDVVVRWLEEKSNPNTPGSPGYLECLVKALAANVRLRGSRIHANAMVRIEQAVMRLVQNCVCASNQLRSVVARTLSDLLKDDRLSCMGRLDGSFMQFLAKVILSDEVGIIKLSNVQNIESPTDWFQDRMNHPVYGCRSTDRVFRVSVYTVMRDLIPIKYSGAPTPSKPKNPIKSYYDDMPSAYETGYPSYMKCGRRQNPSDPVVTELDDGVALETPASGQPQVARLVVTEGSREYCMMMNVPLRLLVYRKYNDQRTFENTNGHAVIPLSLRVVAPTDFVSDPNDVSSIPPRELTMLQHFALVGGFLNLARFFPMTDHFGNIRTAYDILLQKQVEATRQKTEASSGNGKSKPFSTTNKKIKIQPKIAIHGLQSHAAQLHADISHVVSATQKLQQQFQQQLAQQQYQQFLSSSASQVQAMIAGQPVELSVIEPSAILSYQNTDDSMPSSSAVLVSGPSGGNIGGGGDSPFQVLELPVSISSLPYSYGPGGASNTATLSATLNALAANVGGLIGYANSVGPSAVATKAPPNEAEVPAYTIYALSMFLRLEYYAISLVTLDRLQGKRVLQAAMGFMPDRIGIPNVSNFRPVFPKAPTPVVLPGTTDNNPVPERKYGFSHQYQAGPFVAPKPNSDSDSQVQNSRNTATYKDSGNLDMLTVYPFTVLEKIWTVTSPSVIGQEASATIRKDPETFGAIDIILLFVTRISNVKPRTGSAVMSKETRVIDRIFALTDQIDTLRDALANSSSTPPSKVPPPGAGMFSPPSGSNVLSVAPAVNDAPPKPPTTGMPSSAPFGATVSTPATGGSSSNGSQDDYWAKGTGFGSGTTQAQWNLNDHVRKQRLKEEAITCMLNTISGFLAPSFQAEGQVNLAISEIGLVLADDPSQFNSNLHHEPLPAEQQFVLPFEVLFKVANSSLLPIVQQYLSNDSILDVCKNLSVIEACLWFIITLASLRPLEATPEQLVSMGYASDANRDFLVNMLCQEYRGDCVLKQMRRMCRQVKVVLTAVNKRKMALRKDVGTATTPPVIDEESYLKMEIEVSNDTETLPEQTITDEAQDQSMEDLHEMLQRAITVVEQRLESAGVLTDNNVMEVDKTDALVAAADGLANEELYMSQMKPLQYDSLSFLDPKDARALIIPHHYATQFVSNLQMGNPKRMRRLAQEAITLSNSLPLSASSSVFLRACEERLDVFKVLITGPEGTPYANGCFEFDAYFPPDYPNSPLQITLQTTGNNTVRFNPNLYNDGKVCLSVLNTWHGRPEERWNAETSSFLQVLVSIQSLILVSDPYFNEPGYERSRNSPAGQRASRDYDANIRAMNVRWAMLENLRHPPKAFEDVVRRHFWMKRDEIYNQIQTWMGEMQAVIDGTPDQADRTVRAAYTNLKRSAEQIAELFFTMQPPSGLEGVISKHYPNKATQAPSAGGDANDSTSTAILAAPVPTADDEDIADEEPTPSSSKD